MIGIAHDRVKVHHFAERFAGPDPMIDGLQQMLLYFGIVTRNRDSFGRDDRATNYSNAAGMRTSNHLLIAAVISSTIGAAASEAREELPSIAPGELIPLISWRTRI